MYGHGHVRPVDRIKSGIDIDIVDPPLHILLQADQIRFIGKDLFPHRTDPVFRTVIQSAPDLWEQIHPYIHADNAEIWFSLRLRNKGGSPGSFRV